ncbi:MAG: helix-turn-helix domain-containing protein [Acidimicrobiales bacterium]
MAAIVTGPALEAYFDLSPDAMCIVELDGTLVAANAAAGDLFRSLPEELVGRPLSSLFAADLDSVELLAGLKERGRCQSLNSHFRVSIDGVTEDGRSFPMDLSLIPLKENLTTLTLAVMRGSSEFVPIPAMTASAPASTAAQEMISCQRELLVEIAHGHGVGGIAEALSRRTGRQVLILDPVGKVLAGAGYEDVADVPQDHLVGSQLHSPHGVRERQNQSWTAAACPDHRLLGRISIFDPDGDLPEPALSALEHATSILAGELLRHGADGGDGTTSLSEFTHLLLDGRAPETVGLEASLLGCDLEAPHLAVVVDTPVNRDATIEVVGQAAKNVGVKCPLVTSRAGRTVLLVPGELPWNQFTSILSTSFGARAHVGVGGPYKLSMIGRSLEEAVFALKLGTELSSDSSVTKFWELGVWRILVDSSETTKLRQLVDEWIGTLIQHDRLHNSELVKTLTMYLKESCATEATATLLHVHRNTLRYRLSKIALITGRDLGDPDQRFQLELVCRAWLVLQALEDA